MTDTATKKKDEQPVLFKQTKPGDVAFLLMPSDQKDYERVIEKLAELQVTEDSLPKLRKEIDSKKLSRSHVIYTATCPVSKRNLKKQPVEWSLKIAGPYRVETYFGEDLSSDDDNETLDIGALIDAMTKGVHPFCMKLSNDKHLKLSAV